MVFGNRFSVASDSALICTGFFINWEVSAIRICTGDNCQLILVSNGILIQIPQNLGGQPESHNIVLCLRGNTNQSGKCIEVILVHFNSKHCFSRTVACTDSIHKHCPVIIWIKLFVKQFVADTDAGHAAPVNLQIYFLDGGKHLEGDLNGDVVFRHIKRGVRTGIDDHTGIARLINRNGVYSIAVIRRDVDGAVAASGASRINRVLTTCNSCPAVVTDGICDGKVVSNVNINLCNSGFLINRIVTDQISSAEVIVRALNIGGHVKTCAGGTFNRGCIALAAVGAAVPLVADLHALRAGSGNCQGSGAAQC